jgi:mannose-1-phosphate guanylyltransferase
VIQGTFSWSDVGSWSAVDLFWHRDPDGNAFKGEVVAVDVHNAIVDSSNKLPAIVGINDAIVIDTPDVLLICTK